MTAVPRTPDVLRLFRELGKRIFYVTNNGTKTRGDLVNKCRSLQFEAYEDNIVCTSNLSARYLQGLGFKKKAYVIGNKCKIPQIFTS